jgi:fucose 4-O-acetylase-like acetyltransferase
MDPFNSRYILNEKRWLWIDYDKGISIILVGFGHCFATLNDHALPLDKYPFINYFNTFMYGFRMPLFFIVSGLLVGRSLLKKGWGGYVSDRTNNILYPLFIWGSIQVTVRLLSSRYTDNGATPWNYLQLLTDPRQDGPFWYLNALFFIGSIYALIKAKLKLPAWVQVVFGLGLYSVNAWIKMTDHNFGFLNDICEYYFFFALGDLVSDIMLGEGNIQRFTSWKIFVPLAILFIGVQYYFTKDNLLSIQQGLKYGMQYTEYKQPFWFMVEALIGCATSLSFSFLLQKYKVFTFIRIVGYHSLFVYCMQIITMSAARIFCLKVLHLYYVPALVLIVWTAGIILPIFFYNFCLKYGLWWLYTYKKPKKQVEYMKNASIFWFNRNKKDILKEENEALMNTN